MKSAENSCGHTAHSVLPEQASGWSHQAEVSSGVHVPRLKELTLEKQEPPLIPSVTLEIGKKMNSNREVSGHQRIIEKTCRSHGANKKKFEQHCFWQPVDTHVPCQALIRLTTSNRTKFFVQQHVSHTSSKLETEHKSLLTSASFKEASKKKKTNPNMMQMM